MKNLLHVAILFCTINVYAQRDTLPLNTNWQFAIDKNAIGMQQNWFNKPLASAKNVTLPHTWNIETENQNHYGWGWYQKKINVPLNWQNKNVVLQFGAVNHTAIIYLNGVKINEHIGDGFNKFYINLNGKLNYGKENVFTVAVNNDFGNNKVPFGSSFDWPNDGGIIRKACIIISNKPAANYIHATPKLNPVNNQGQLQIKLGFDNNANRNIKFNVSISEENQPAKNLIYSATLTPQWLSNEAFVHINIPQVNPWHFDFPNLYKVNVTVMDGKKTADKISTTVGFRELKFEKGSVFLNGENIKLMGVEWTAGSNPDYGFAESDSVIVSQCKLMKNVNAIFTRQHFQQDDLFYECCDRFGILVQQEVPLWGYETPANDTINNIAHKQLQSMIRNMYNHVSVFSWGVGNELRARDADMKAMIAGLLQHARNLDSTRFTAYVSNSLTQGFYNSPSFVADAAADGDYLMMNEYGGSWWDIPTGNIHAYLDSVHATYPKLPFFISEFGLCEPNFKGGDERRIADLIYHMGIYETKPYIAGAIYFDLTDYRTHYPGTNDTTKYRRRIHGVYDMFGQPKPSMKILRELSAPIEIQNVRHWQKDKLNLLLFGSMGLPQHAAKGYKLYVSSEAQNYAASKAYPLPDIMPGQRINFEVDEINSQQTYITIVRPNGFIASQKAFD